MTIVIFPIEPIPTRYSIEWFESIPKTLQKLTNEEVIQISGITNAGKPTDGAFLDFLSTNQWKNEQVNEFFNLVKIGRIEKGSKLLFTDAWNPAIIGVKYVNDLMNMGWELHGIWHAGRYDEQDFLGRMDDKSGWVTPTEKAMFSALDYNYFATDFHIKLFLEGVFGTTDVEDATRKKMIKSGQPHDLLIETLQNFPKQTKRRQIIFPHRLAPEKQLAIFKDLEKSMPDVNFVVCQEQPLTKDEYHTLMSESMVCFSASLQETYGISSACEAPLLRTIPIVPDRLSYTELFQFQQDFKYPSDWTINWDAYLQNKDKLIRFLYNVLDNYNVYDALLDNFLIADFNKYARASIMFDKLTRRN